MDTFRQELEQAVPHVDPGPDGVDDLVASGHRAVRRRRARLGGALAGGGLVVAAVAAGFGAGPGPDRTPRAEDPTVATAPSAPRAARTERPDVPLTLESLLEVAGRCPGAARERPERVNALVADDGWAAVEFACDDGTIRVLRTREGEVVGRYRVERRLTLEEWAEAKVG